MFKKRVRAYVSRRLTGGYQPLKDITTAPPTRGSSVYKEKTEVYLMLKIEKEKLWTLAGELALEIGRNRAQPEQKPVRAEDWGQPEIYSAFVEILNRKEKEGNKNA